MSEEGTKDRPGNNHYLFNLMKKYDTGWINRSDWTNVHLGSDTTKDTDSNVTHGLDATLDQLMIKVLVATSDAYTTVYEISRASISGVSDYGYTPYYIDDDNIKIQTGANGLLYFSDNGTGTVIDTEDWYYKVVVYKISCKDYS